MADNTVTKFVRNALANRGLFVQFEYAVHLPEKSANGQDMYLIKYLNEHAGQFEYAPVFVWFEPDKFNNQHGRFLADF